MAKFTIVESLTQAAATSAPVFNANEFSSVFAKGNFGAGTTVMVQAAIDKDAPEEEWHDVLASAFAAPGIKNLRLGYGCYLRSVASGADGDTDVALEAIGSDGE